MTQLLKVITNPYALVGFVLFIFFNYLERARRNATPHWFAPAATIAGYIVLLGGLFLAYLQVPKTTPGTIQQTSSGEASPNINGVRGNVDLTIDQSNKVPDGEKSPKQDLGNKTK